MGGTMLQIFLLINIFLIGVLVTIAIQHLYAHFHPHEADHVHGPAPHPVKLSPEVRQKLLEKAANRFQRVLDQAAHELETDLAHTKGELNKQVDSIGKDIVGKEMERYRSELDELRARAEAAIGGAQAEVTAHQEELKAQMAADVEAEKQRLLAQIDTKLADAVASFLSEALPHNVDLGAQSEYLTSLLEEHKADFAREVQG